MYIWSFSRSLSSLLFFSLFQSVHCIYIYIYTSCLIYIIISFLVFSNHLFDLLVFLITLTSQYCHRLVIIIFIISWLAYIIPFRTIQRFVVSSFHKILFCQFRNWSFYSWPFGLRLSRWSEPVVYSNWSNPNISKSIFLAFWGSQCFLQDILIPFCSAFKALPNDI